MSAESLQKLAESKFDIKAAKLALLERVDSQLIFTYGGGLFKATPELIALLKSFHPPHSPDNPIVILDEYKNPVKVNLISITELAIKSNQYAMNAYLNDYEILKKVRKGDKL